MLACGVVLVATTAFNQPDSTWRKAFDAAGASWQFHFQELNYHDNGFVAGFLYNFAGEPMSRPADVLARDDGADRRSLGGARGATPRGHRRHGPTSSSC